MHIVKSSGSTADAGTATGLGQVQNSKNPSQYRVVVTESGGRVGIGDVYSRPSQHTELR